MPVDYGEVRTKFLRRLNRRDCTNALADDFIDDSIQRIQRVLRVPMMEKFAVTTVGATDSAYTDAVGLQVPTDLLKLRELTVISVGGVEVTLESRPLSFVEQHASASGAVGSPRYYARRGTVYVIAPEPLDGDILTAGYWAEFDALAQDTDDNRLVAVGDDLIIYGALSFACDHWNDKRGPLFEQRFTQALSDIQAQGDDDELSAQPAVQPAFFYPSD
jgi:hypothetical protein